MTTARIRYLDGIENCTRGLHGTGWTPSWRCELQCVMLDSRSRSSLMDAHTEAESLPNAQIESSTESWSDATIVLGDCSHGSMQGPRAR